MNVEAIADRLERTPAALAALLRGLPRKDAQRRSPGGAWSIAEIVGHLVDEEREDFPSRLRSILEDPSKKWPPLDPEKSVIERRHNETPLDDLLGAFERERAESVKWLRSLRDPNWSNVYKPRPGPLTASQMLANWAAHDALHIRQIARRLYELAERDAEGESIEYAGTW